MLLQLEDVTKQYPGPAGGAPAQVLGGISLEIAEGASLAVVGPSGSGKSTLLNLMAALDRPTSGAVRLAGKDLAELADAELAAVRNRDIGLIFQLHHLLPQCTALENTLVPTIPAGGADAEVLDRARGLLDRVGLGDRMDHRPGQLSGGECQRVAVVRALINGPKLVLADEPTGSLDEDSADSLGDLLVQLNAEQGMALVTVTHSMTLARRMGARYLLQGGTLEAQQ